MSAFGRWLRPAGLVLLVVLAMAATWRVQEWRCRQRLHENARLEAQRVCRAFVSGVAPLVIASRQDSFELAALSFRTTSRVGFLELLDAEGKSLYTSRPGTLAGRDVGLRWVLERRQLGTRPGERPDEIEVAAPIAAPEGPIAFLWLGYRLDEGG